MPFNPYMFSPQAFGPQQNFGSSPFGQMRARSIFDKPTDPEENTKRFLSQVNPPRRADFSQPDTSDDSSDEGGKYFQDLMKLRKPGPATTAYQAALKEQPTDDNTQVSTSRKVMGTLAGIAGGFAKGPEAGVSAANEIIDSPYKTAIRDYQIRMKNLGESAKLEQDEAADQATALSKAREFGLSHDKYRSELANQAFERGIKERTTATGERGATTAERRATTAEQEAGTHLTDVKNRGSIGVLNAADAAKRTDIMGRQADTAAAGQKDTARYRTGLLELKGKEGKKVSPSQQNYALDVAYRQLASDPQFSDFVKKDERGFFDVKPDKVDQNSLTYQSFQRRLKVLAEAAIKKGTPYDDVPDDVDDDLVTIGKPRK